MALLHALEDCSPRRRFNVVELGTSNYLWIDESLVVRPTKIGKDVEGFDIRALCCKRAPHVVRSTLQPFACQPREVTENGVAGNFGPDRQQRERRDGNPA
jgi:hypothetical protein